MVRPDPRDRILGTDAWVWVLGTGTSGREPRARKLLMGGILGTGPARPDPLGWDPTRLNSLRIESCPAEPS